MAAKRKRYKSKAERDRLPPAPPPEPGVQRTYALTIDRRWVRDWRTGETSRALDRAELFAYVVDAQDAMGHLLERLRATAPTSVVALVRIETKVLVEEAP